MSAADLARTVSEIIAGRFDPPTEIGNPFFLKQVYAAALGRDDIELTPPVLTEEVGRRLVGMTGEVSIPAEAFIDGRLTSSNVVSYGTLIPPKGGTSWHDTTPVVNITPLVNDGSTPPVNPVLNPPWERAFYVYERTDGFQVVMLAVTGDGDGGNRGAIPDLAAVQAGLDWDAVRWTTQTFAWVAIPGQRPLGPVTVWTMLIDEDGQLLLMVRDPLEPELEQKITDVSTSLYGWATAFLACRNITIREAHYARPEMRRIARTGIKLSELTVTSIGESVKASGLRRVGSDMPLTSVRGHFAEYGPKYGKGLLFGRIDGRFWIPQHARGAIEHGATVQEFTLGDSSTL